MLSKHFEITRHHSIRSLQVSKDYQQINAHLNHYAIQSDAPWGFVAFRTVYSANSDRLWSDMLEIMHSAVQSSLSHAKQTDLLPATS